MDTQRRKLTVQGLTMVVQCLRVRHRQKYNAEPNTVMGLNVSASHEAGRPVRISTDAAHLLPNYQCSNKKPRVLGRLRARYNSGQKSTCHRFAENHESPKSIAQKMKVPALRYPLPLGQVFQFCNLATKSSRTSVTFMPNRSTPGLMSRSARTFDGGSYPSFGT